MFSIVPAPGRQFKTASMLLGIFIGSFDAVVGLLAVFGDIHWLSANQVLGINAFLGFLIVPAKLWKQEVNATTEQKKELIAAAVEQPIAPGHQDVTAVIVPTGTAPIAATPTTPTPAENTERLKAYIEMTVNRAIKDAMATKPKPPAKRKRSRPPAHPVVPPQAPETFP